MQNLTADQKVVCSNHAGCIPQHQRFTNNFAALSRDVLGHFLDTFAITLLSEDLIQTQTYVTATAGQRDS